MEKKKKSKSKNIRSAKTGDSTKSQNSFVNEMVPDSEEGTKSRKKNR